jgi:hypothetical protein
MTSVKSLWMHGCTYGSHHAGLPQQWIISGLVLELMDALMMHDALDWLVNHEQRTHLTLCLPHRAGRVGRYLPSMQTQLPSSAQSGPSSSARCLCCGARLGRMRL